MQDVCMEMCVGGVKSSAFKAFSYYKPHSATNINTHKSFFFSYL